MTRNITANLSYHTLVSHAIGSETHGPVSKNALAGAALETSDLTITYLKNLTYDAAKGKSIVGSEPEAGLYAAEYADEAVERGTPSDMCEGAKDGLAARVKRKCKREGKQGLQDKNRRRAQSRPRMR